MLSVRHVSKRYGGVAALADVSVEVPDNAIVGLVGPNGSGKSTLFGIVSGFVLPDGGGVFFDGQPIVGERPDAIARRGLCRTFQLQPAPDHLTVRDSVLAAFPSQQGDSLFGAFFRRGAMYVEEGSRRIRAAEILEMFELAPSADRFCGSLSGGQQKLLAVARAVASGARLILLDEPAAGVSPPLRAAIARMLRTLKERHGRTILLVEHDMRFVGETCEDVYVLDAGRIIAHGSPGAIRKDPGVLAAYLGRSGSVG